MAGGRRRLGSPACHLVILASSCRHLGVILANLGVTLASPWRHLGVILAHLGTSWQILASPIRHHAVTLAFRELVEESFPSPILTPKLLVLASIRANSLGFLLIFLHASFFVSLPIRLQG